MFHLRRWASTLPWKCTLSSGLVTTPPRSLCHGASRVPPIRRRSRWQHAGENHEGLGVALRDRRLLHSTRRPSTISPCLAGSRSTNPVTFTSRRRSSSARARPAWPEPQTYSGRCRAAASANVRSASGFGSRPIGCGLILSAVHTVAGNVTSHGRRRDACTISRTSFTFSGSRIAPMLSSVPPCRFSSGHVSKRCLGPCPRVSVRPGTKGKRIS